MKRIGYFFVFLSLLLIEIVIARYLHDQVIRPYVGDILVVLLLYCMVRLVEPQRWKNLPVFVFLFAASVELLQYFHLVQHLHLEHNKLLCTIIGSTFDWKDIACYGAGCLILLGYEKRWRRTKKNLFP